MMPTIFFALDEHVQMFVDNPGHGEIVVRGFADDDSTLSLVGAHLGRLLEETTSRALGGPAVERPVLPRFVTTAQAVELVPVVQRAVLLAVAGEDRYQRVEVEPDTDPEDVLCVHCNEGSVFDQTVTISERCTEHGHTPFGYATDTTWDQAQARREAARRRR